MGGLFGVASKKDCVLDLYYGTDYHSHLGTKRGGMCLKNGKGYSRSIHNIENSYFRTKFESELVNFQGHLGIGAISDTDPQPQIFRSHLGTYGIVTVGKINNLDALVKDAFAKRRYFSDTTDGTPNPTEMVAMLICDEATIEEGIRHAQRAIEGSCSLLLLNDKDPAVFAEAVHQVLTDDALRGRVLALDAVGPAGQLVPDAFRRVPSHLAPASAAEQAPRARQQEPEQRRIVLPILVHGD